MRTATITVVLLLLARISLGADAVTEDERLNKEMRSLLTAEDGCDCTCLTKVKSLLEQRKKLREQNPTLPPLTEIQKTFDTLWANQRCGATGGAAGGASGGTPTNGAGPAAGGTLGGGGGANSGCCGGGSTGGGGVVGGGGATHMESPFGGGPWSGGNVQVTGAGATTPYPVYSKWFSEYHKLHPDVQIDYQSIGSGGGIRQLSANTVFFGASDGPMTSEQIQASGMRILHLPTLVIGVVPIYNVPDVSGELRFSGPVLADIYLGKITKWNDAAIRNLNPGVNVPGVDITVVHRSDGSGTNYIFSDFLAKVSYDWKRTAGVATSVNWPVGVGGKGNEGVAGLVKQTPGSIGYVDYVYAFQNRLSYGLVQNSSGYFVRASADTLTAAAAAATPNIPADFRVSITNAPGKEAYPISSFTWLLLNARSHDPLRTRAITGFSLWALRDGQRYAIELGYAPLPDELVKREQAALKPPI